MRAGAAVLLAWLTAVAPCAAQAPSTIQADGPVREAIPTGSKLLLVGDFGSLGPLVGGGVAVDPASGARDPRFPMLRGPVSDALPDGRGGWYLAGAFLRAGELGTDGLAHLRSDGSVDARFAATPYERRYASFYDALAAGGGRLYAGRYFGGVRAVDTATGRPIRDFAPELREQMVSELLLAGGRLYAGGEDVVALDPATGARDRGFDCVGCRSERVTALASDGERLFVATPERGLFAVDPATGALDRSFRPSPNRVGGRFDDRGALTLLVAGGRLLVGGRDLDVGGPSRSLAALDVRTGRADPEFGRAVREGVHDLALDGRAVIAGGGGGRPVVRWLSLSDGRVLRTARPAFDGPVDAVAAGHDRAFVGGRFTREGAIRSGGAAVVDRASLRLDPDFAIRTENVPNRWLAGRAHVAGLDERYDDNGSEIKDLLLRIWTLRDGRAVTMRVLATRGGRFEADSATAHGDLLYVASQRRGPGLWKPCTVHVISLATGREVRRWRLPFPGYVDALRVDGGRLYVGGSFRRWHPWGEPAHLATLALDRSSGRFLPSFDAHTRGPVETISVSRRRLLLTGYFDRVGIAGRSNIAAVDARTGQVDTSFRPRLGRLPLDERSLGRPTPFGSRSVLLPNNFSLTPLLLDARTGRKRALEWGLGGTGELLATLGPRRFLVAGFGWVGLDRYAYLLTTTRR